jgi:ribosomal protein L11 methyltransferase
MRTWPALVVQFPPPGAAAGEVGLGDLVAAELDGLEVVAVVEQSDREWQVYFREASMREAAAHQIEHRLGAHGLTMSRLDVPDGDWARRTQEALGAIHVGALTVAPPWDQAAQSPGAGTIIIEPAMGFGSGHHATTRLCLAALQRLDLRDRQVVDIGTGSGVLALAAARLGAREVLGIDVDEDALENARTNAALNGSPATVTFERADFRQGSRAASDVVVANLTGGMLLAGAAALLSHVRRPGVLILSGITDAEAEDVARAFRAHAREDWSAAEDGWCAFSYSL